MHKLLSAGVVPPFDDWSLENLKRHQVRGRWVVVALVHRVAVFP